MLGISRRVWIVSGVVFLSMLIIWLFFFPPVIIDTFDPQRPPTFVEILAVNLLAYWWLLCPPPLAVLLAGWIIQRVRNQDSN